MIIMPYACCCGMVRPGIAITDAFIIGAIIGAAIISGAPHIFSRASVATVGVTCLGTAPVDKTKGSTCSSLFQVTVLWQG